MVGGGSGHKYLWLLNRHETIKRSLYEQLREKAESMGYNLNALVISGKIVDDE